MRVCTYHVLSDFLEFLIRSAHFIVIFFLIDCAKFRGMWANTKFPEILNVCFIPPTPLPSIKQIMSTHTNANKHVLDTMKYPIFEYWSSNLWQIYFLALISRPSCVIYMLLKYKCTFFYVWMFQDEDLVNMVQVGKRMEAMYQHYFDCTITNDNLQRTFMELKSVISRVQTQEQWVSSKWLR